MLNMKVKVAEIKPCQSTLYEINPYFRDIINNLKISDAWKVQVIMVLSCSKKVIYIIKRNNVKS